MIKTLRVLNYLSLRDVNLELSARNVLIGPNMAGKSNLVNCFQFLSQVAISGLMRAFQDRGGFSEVVWKGGDESRISFQLTGEVISTDKGTPKAYEYELSIIGSATGSITVEREHLVAKTGNLIYPLIDLRYGQGKITHADGSSVFTLPSPSQSALEFPVPGWEGTAVRDLISRWRFYRLVPAVMKQANAATEQVFLNSVGDNFSSWFMTLQGRHPLEFRLIKQAAVDVFPELEEILTPPTQFATTYVTTRERHLKQPVSIWHMSDGELTFLALLSLIFAPPSLGAPLYCIEEPENHLHPRLLETLVELLTQRQSELGPQAAQIIVTTHSPHLVDKVNLDELIVVEKRNGATYFTRPASKRGLKELLESKELGLGDLWYSGALSEN
jgi:predicted ATPase